MKNEYTIDCSIELTPETRKLFDEIEKEYQEKVNSVEELLRQEVENVLDRIEWKDGISEDAKESAKACFRSFGFDIAKSGWNACFEYHEIGGKSDEMPQM